MQVWKPIIGWYGTPNFCGENFCGWLQNREIRECFSLESFMLYGKLNRDGGAKNTETS